MACCPLQLRPARRWHGFKADLIARGEATDLFARERLVDAFAALLGQPDQTVFGEPVYPSVEAEGGAPALTSSSRTIRSPDGNKRWRSASLFCRLDLNTQRLPAR